VRNFGAVGLKSCPRMLMHKISPEKVEESLVQVRLHWAWDIWTSLPCAQREMMGVKQVKLLTKVSGIIGDASDIGGRSSPDARSSKYRAVPGYPGDQNLSILLEYVPVGSIRSCWWKYGNSMRTLSVHIFNTTQPGPDVNLRAIFFMIVG